MTRPRSGSFVLSLQAGLSRLSPKCFDELFDGHACVSDEGAQESGLQFTVFGHCEWQAGIVRMP